MLLRYQRPEEWMEKLVAGVGAGKAAAGSMGAGAGVLRWEGVLDVESRGGCGKLSRGCGSECVFT